MEDFAKMRESIYKSVDAIIFCFSLANIEMNMNQTHMHSKSENEKQKKGSSSLISLGNVKTLWMPEVERALSTGV